MTQMHPVQEGLFHITTNTKKYVPWMIYPGIPKIIVDNLAMTKHIHNARLHAFCILPDHMHLLVSPGAKGISSFMHSFKRNTMRDIRSYLGSGRSRSSAVRYVYWQKSFHSEHINSDQQRSHALHYVKHNAVRHKLVNDMTNWQWSSKWFPHLLDEMEIWCS